MSITLHGHQDKVVNEIRARMVAGQKRIMVCSPTGSGKTILTAFMAKTSAAKGHDSWFIVHRVELIRQSILAFNRVGIDFGVVGPGFEVNRKPKVQIVMVNSVKKRMHLLRKPSIIFPDEAHHFAAKSYMNIGEALPDCYYVGLSATPQRLDGKGLDFFKAMVKGPSPSWLIENGFLCPYRLFAPPTASMEGVHRVAGDFNRKEVAWRVDKPTITGNAVAEYKKLAMGKRAIARGVSIEHSKHIAEQFNSAGISAIHVDGDSSPEDRFEAMQSFQRGETLVLTNVDLFSEGVDVPSVECVLDLRPTESLTLWLQFCGRALRTSPGKTHAIIIDMAGNSARHGLPHWDREWSLAGNAGLSASGADGRKVKTCPKCYAVQIAGREACQFCKHVFETNGRDIDEVEGSLVEVNSELFEKGDILNELSKPKREKTREEMLWELVAIGKKRGYRNSMGWAKQVLDARQARRNAGL